MRHAAGELADGFHLLGLTKRLLGLTTFGDIDRLGQHAGNRAMLIEHRPHRKIKIAVADGQMQKHFGSHAFALPDRGKAIEDRLAGARCRGKPERIPKRLANDVRHAGLDPGQRRLVGVDNVALQIQQSLVLVAGFKDGAQLRFVGLKLRGTFLDPLLEGFIQTAQFAFGFLGRRDVVSHPDKADVFPRRVPARL